MTIGKKNLLIIAGAVLGVAALGACGFVLVKVVGQLHAAEKKLNTTVDSLTRYYSHKPFPASSNVVAENSNVETVRRAFNSLGTAFRSGEVKPIEGLTPSRFISLLGEKLNTMRTTGEECGTLLPANFAFGFDKYCGPESNLSSLDAQVLPGLSRQLLTIESLCSILFKNKVKEIDKIIRHDEKLKLAGAEASEAVTNALPSDYSKFHYTVEFSAKEDALLGVMNGIASNPVFMIVTYLKIEKGTPDVIDTRPVATGAGAGPAKTATPARAPAKSIDPDDLPVGIPAAPGARTDAAKSGDAKKAEVDEKKLPRSERLVCGREIEKPMKIKMMIDVYYGFAGD